MFLHDVRNYLWDDFLLSKRGADQVIKRRVPDEEVPSTLHNVIHHHMRDTLVSQEQSTRFYSMDSFGLLSFGMPMHL